MEEPKVGSAGPRRDRRSRLSVVQAEALRSSRAVLEQRQHGEGPEKDPEAEDASGAETGGHAKLLLELAAAKDALKAAQEQLPQVEAENGSSAASELALAALKQELTEARNKQAESREEAARAEKSTAEWRAEHAELAGDAKKHKDELQEATTARDKLQEEMNTEAEELKEAQSSGAEAASKNLEEVKEEVARAEKSTAEWRAEHAELAGDAKKHKDELQDATAARDKLQEEMKTSAEELKEAQSSGTEAASKNVEELKEEVARAEKSTAEWRAEHAELAGDVKKHKDELQEATAARDKLQEKMKTEERAERASLVAPSDACSRLRLDSGESEPGHEVQQRLLLLHQTETDLRRALAAHRYVVRHMVAEQPPNPPNPAAHAKRRETSASESEGEPISSTVRRSVQPSGRDCQDFLFSRAASAASSSAASAMPASAVAWLRGEPSGG
ncbi:unnamed protein product [Effrenium voratum]|uniref:Uncharacterized protein n=1 Tax=Effrenium voratum TaxID=2562239 RepID=A0AA36I5D6_9DINO|nr:unnamed protein product [Effrenium voratum]